MPSIRAVAGAAYRGALPALLASGLGGLVAGVILGGMDAELRAVPGLLVMVPAFLAIRGSVYGSLGSRLSSALHQGILDPVVETGDRLVAALLAAFGNGLLASVAAALLTYGMLAALDRTVAPVWALLGVAVLAGVLTGVVLSVVVVAVAFYGYRRGYDPDDLVGPAVTTAGDVFGMAALYVAARVVATAL